MNVDAVFLLALLIAIVMCGFFTVAVINAMSRFLWDKLNSIHETLHEIKRLLEADYWKRK